MPRVAWLTDVHLNWLEPADRRRFYASVRETGAERVWLTGDVAERPQLLQLLAELDDHLELPLDFVLGNHDYYFGSIAQTRSEVEALCRSRPRLRYLTLEGPVAVTPGVALVGHDGWADARLGDYERSLVMMQDYKLIAELAQSDKRGRWPLLQALGDEAAAVAGARLEQAFQRHPAAYLLTHVPPFAESCVYQGQPSNAEWLPHFSCRAMGQALLALMVRRPECRLTVLCGHTHGEVAYQPLANLVVLTGGARYGEPSVQRVWEIP